jgi:hypothetical protein
MEPYKVVAALLLSEEMKQADLKLLLSAAILEFIAPSIIIDLASSKLSLQTSICFKDAAKIPTL